MSEDERSLKHDLRTTQMVIPEWEYRSCFENGMIDKFLALYKKILLRNAVFARIDTVVKIKTKYLKTMEFGLGI